MVVSVVTCVDVTEEVGVVLVTELVAELVPVEDADVVAELVTDEVTELVAELVTVDEAELVAEVVADDVLELVAELVTVDEAELVPERVGDVERLLTPRPSRDLAERSDAGRGSFREVRAGLPTSFMGRFEFRYCKVEGFGVGRRRVAVAIRLGVETGKNRSLTVEVVTTWGDTLSGNSEDGLIEHLRSFDVGYGNEHSV